MKKILLIAGLCMLVACDGIGGDDGGDDNRTRVPTDLEELSVWNAVYDSDYRYPEGFYTEPQAAGTSILYLGDNVTQNGKFIYKQRSTDSREQAREWWYSMMEINPDQPRITEENETDRYFEFVAVTSRGHTTRWRFHKSGYYTPLDGMFNTFYYIVLYPELYEPYTIGIYGGELSSAATREFIESMWYFENLNSGGKVLSTDLTETPDSFVYTIVSTGLTIGDWGLHDKIRVFESTLAVDKTTREFRSTGCALLQTIQGKFHPNAFE